MSYLRRTRVGSKFNIEKSLNLEEIEAHKYDLNYICENIIKVEDLFEKNGKIILKKQVLEKFLNGVKLRVNNDDGVYKIYDDYENFIGTGEVNMNILKRDVII